MEYLDANDKEHNHYLQVGGGFWLYRSIDGKLMACQKDGDVLLQFIGLPDKNGKDIYDGDIVLFGFGDTVVARIHWDNTYLQWDLTFLKNVSSSPSGIKNFWSDRIEVIGNIYQNHELLIHEPS
jgi:uncharacterized phage protein (TIGR01671 family)